MSPRLLPAALLLLASVTACGPSTSSDVKLNGEAVNVLFGAKPTPTPAAQVPVVSGANPTPHFPSIIEPPVPPAPTVPPGPPATVSPSAVPTASPCPTAARPGVKEIAPATATKQPAAATYEYQTTTSVLQTLPAGPESKTEARRQRSIANVRAADDANAGAVNAGTGAFLYDVVEQVGTTGTLTTTYLVAPQGATGGVDAGLHLYSTQADTADGGKDVFAPVTPLKLMPFPALEATAWESAATDPRTQITYRISGRVQVKQRVNFCGQGVDSWRMQVTGSIAGPGRVINITDLTYDVGTQYGGLLLHSSLQLEGYDPDGQYRSTQTSTILAEPSAAL